MKKLIKFSTQTCSPCRQIKPIFDKVRSSSNIMFEEVDCTENTELAKSLNIRSVPTLVLLEDGVEIKRNVGLISEKDLLKFIS